MKRSLKYKAQDEIVGAIVAAILKAEESGNTELADAMRVEATTLARRWNLVRVPGLPETFEEEEV